MENLTTNRTIDIPESFLLEKFNERILNLQMPAIIYTAILMLVGIPGNAVVLYIYFFKWRRSTSRMFILYLALFDLICCLTILPMEIVTMRYSVMMDKPVLCKIFRFSTYSMNSSSALVLLGIAVDRFRRICRPYQRTFSEQISKYICIGAIAISVSVTSPSLILYGKRDISLGTIRGQSCLIQNKYDHTEFPIFFLGIMGLMTFVIFTALVVLYYCVGMQIYKHRQFKKKRCSHVEKVNVDRSTTDVNDKPKAVEEKDKSVKRTTEQNGTEAGLCLPEVSKDMVKIKSESNNSSPENNLSGSFQTKEGEIDQDTLKSDESPKRVPKQTRKRVKYVFMRSASTLYGSGRTKCINCVTVRIGKSTFMLFLITLAYIISFLPFYTIIIIRQSTDGFVQKLSPAGYATYHVFLRSYLLAAAINPIIYSFCNPQFREHCINLFKRIFLGKGDMPAECFKRRIR